MMYYRYIYIIFYYIYFTYNSYIYCSHTINIADFTQRYSINYRSPNDKNVFFIEKSGFNIMGTLDTNFIILNNSNLQFFNQTIATRSIKNQILITSEFQKYLLQKIHIQGYFVNPDDRFIIIDPGHGGKDPGATYKSLYEKDITLQFSLLLYTKMIDHIKKHNYKIRVFLTRYKDKYVSLKDRVNIVNSLGLYNKGALISIHTNASSNNSNYGLETYYYMDDLNSDNYHKTNYLYNILSDATYMNNLNLSFLNIILNYKINQYSKLLASYVHKYTYKKIKFLTKDRGIKKHNNLYLISKSIIPSILLELGFITNSKEKKLLVTNKYQNILTNGVIEGVLQFINKSY